MKPEQMYHHLKEIAEKLDITVREENLKKTASQTKSGFCKINEKKMFIVDKSLSIANKNIILAALLGKIPHDDIYIAPAVREFIFQSANPLKNIKRDRPGKQTDMFDEERKG